VEQVDCCFDAPEQQFGKAAEEKPDAVAAFGGVERHGPLDRRQGLAGAAQKGGVVAGKAVGDAEAVIHRQRLLEGTCSFFELSGGGVQHALSAFCEGVTGG
jgi:hypothetical protein